MRYAFQAIIITIYGYNRCDVRPLNPVEMVSECSLFTKLHTLLRDSDISMDSLFSLLEYRMEHVGDDSKMATLKELTTQFVALDSGLQAVKGTEIGNATHGPNPLNPFTGSFVMKQFDLSDGMLCYCLLVLVLFVLILWTVAYFVLLFKVTRRK
jgi:hypothetical protein